MRAVASNRQTKALASIVIFVFVVFRRHKPHSTMMVMMMIIIILMMELMFLGINMFWALLRAHFNLHLPGDLVT